MCYIKMSKINIQGLQDIDDPFYRYRMTKLNIIRQKTKTVIDNLPIVAKDLDRDPKMIVDFFKKALNASFISKTML
jgi:translation initiation factor 2 beta subunit (eIF-2beta)/eIF-5